MYDWVDDGKGCEEINYFFDCIYLHDDKELCGVERLIIFSIAYISKVGCCRTAGQAVQLRRGGARPGLPPSTRVLPPPRGLARASSVFIVDA
jgi:hypothetical protein